MSISIYNIKKWIKMLSGKSIYHVNQGVGKKFDLHNIHGYYNDLTEKVTKEPELINNDRLPLMETPDGRKIEFSIGIFQYGLGAYDLYLQTNDEKYFTKFKQCLNWAVANQQENGAWDTFSHRYPQNPYSAMAQGEGTSLLLRGYKELGDEKYLASAKKAIDFMLMSVEDGGTTVYKDNMVFLAEYVHKPIVLNGWIFALWGLRDYTLVDRDKRYADLYTRSYETLKEYLPKFSCRYWSMYSLDDMITSPFYHRLHIAQLNVMYQITDNPVFKEYEIKWQKYSNKRLYKTMAFIRKAFQKIMERK